MEIHDDCLRKSVKRLKHETTTNIKECLQPKGLSRFQNLMLNIREICILKVNNDKDPGKASGYQSTLPKHIDPVYTSFGTRRKDPFTVADILNEKDKVPDTPGEQTSRKYKKPFCRHRTYGKCSTAEKTGSKARKLLYWSTEPRFQGSNYLITECNKPQNITMDESLDNKYVDIYEVLHETSVGTNMTKLKNSLSHINSIRLQIKKRTSDIDFFTLKDYFDYFDEDNSNTVSLNKFYTILNSIRIKLDKENFEFLLKNLGLIKGESIYYTEALDLLNWKYKFPEISKIDDAPKKNDYYKTTYQELMIV